MEPRRVRQLLQLSLGFHLLQAVLSTTVLPSCAPGESGGNCTALDQMRNDPRVAQVVRTECSSDLSGYCLHGECVYLVDMSEKHCRCESGYGGSRCEHFFLTVQQQPLSTEYVALAVILTIFVLLLIAGSIYYFWRRRRNRKSEKSRKEYERVTSGDLALPQV